VQRQQDQGSTCHQWQEGQAGDGNMHRQDVPDGAHDVVVDQATVANGLHHRDEVVIEQHHGGRFPCYVGAARSHGHAHVGRDQCRGVVDPVSGHGDHVATASECLHQSQLVLGPDAGKHMG
jgi:hypothetical protein